ncbi:uncharacterized protein LOC109844018 isoform X2 [Asparagus officinalis]|uniref:uncharacterized protein LOC109844018 isoform X2 n=1 Tax=Asparagus officinalis TaxID=4686 RepID=UPI00098E569C|nr:uncharacterized protein LOC109844018 isoform X2 [Asparagus officinalis]
MPFGILSSSRAYTSYHLFVESNGTPKNTSSLLYNRRWRWIIRMKVARRWMMKGRIFWIESVGRSQNIGRDSMKEELVLIINGLAMIFIIQILIIHGLLLHCHRSLNRFPFVRFTFQLRVIGCREVVNLVNGLNLKFYS